MKPFYCTLILIFVSIYAFAQPEYDLRFVHQVTNCLADEIYFDVEIKASSPTSNFNVSLQNYRFNFNLTTVPPISPPIGPPDTNPPDRSVFIEQELTISGTVASSLYAPHTLTGSSGDLVSYNVTLLSGGGYPLTFDTWVQVGRIRFDLADPMPPCLNLTWDAGGTLILANVGGTPTVATAGTLENLTRCGICQVLPVELTRFEVKVDAGCTAWIEWETASETNSSHFLIERSFDGENFELVGRVESAGTSVHSKFYSFSDFVGRTDSYYRLRLVDLDGTESLSDLQYIQSSCDYDEADFGIVSVFPNPVKQDETINILLNNVDNEITMIEIMDSSGRLVRKQEFGLKEGFNLISIDLEVLHHGIFLIRAMADSRPLGVKRVVVD